jgi:alkylation response protein AidB-like acyl-CoA dehydrogenase
MSIALTEEHRALADSVAQLMSRRDARAAARALLDSETEERPDFWSDLVDLGLTGLHVPEEYGGAGAGLQELVVAIEQLGRVLAPGPFLPTVIASATLAAADDDAVKKSLLPGLVDGSRTAGIALDAAVDVRDGVASGEASVVLGGGLADLFVLTAGDDVIVVERGAGVDVTVPANLDQTRRSARVRLDGANATVVAGSAAALRDFARILLSAEAVGIAAACTESAAEYAKVREQFGRPIATFQAVKHHCANMLVATELATAAVWDAARAAALGGEQRALASAFAATLAAPAGYLCANLNIQVHGGIGMTWEHEAHLYLRRATTLRGLLDADGAAESVTALTRAGVRREREVDLPPEAETFREQARAFATSIKGKTPEEQRTAMIEQGYALPHWPKPWGRDAGAIEQIVIEQEFAAAGVKKPSYGITGWVILTLIQYATPEQIERWVRPALDQDVIWCQLFSEPGAGSDAAGVKTSAKKVEGGWIVNGQKVWTSGAHVAGQGFATVRTDPSVPKHDGITIMVIDMKAKGVEVRPLRLTSGGAEFNEVFFNDLFIPDDDVVGPINGGWTVARATLGNESVSIGGGEGAGYTIPVESMVAAFDAHPDRLRAGAARIGRFITNRHAISALNLRSAHRAVAGGGPGPEGNVTKLVLSELSHDAAEILADLSGPEIAFMEGDTVMSGLMVLLNRALSIAGGTSEIKRNQIAERILGLPRDPLIKK